MAFLTGQEGIHANNRQRSILLLVLVIYALFLDLTALVHGVHVAETATGLLHLQSGQTAPLGRRISPGVRRALT